MDLFAAHRAGSWHPLTSLLTMQSDANNRHLYLVPVLDYPNRRDLSTFLHEVAHAWTVRTTRLGFALSHFAANLFLKWKNGEAPVVPPPLAELLGAYLPVLEGIALFAELDFETEPALDRLPTPLTTVGQYYAVNSSITPRSGRLRDVYRLLRHELQGNEPRTRPSHVTYHGKVFERDTTNERPNVVDVLFLTDDRQDLGYYFAGYCYVKAMWAMFRSIDAKYADPARFLPLFVRVIADLPLIDRVVSERVTAVEIVNAVHKSLVDLAEKHLPAVTAFLEIAQHRLEFDLWDLHAQIADNRWDQPRKHGFPVISKYAPINANFHPHTLEDGPFVESFVIVRNQSSVLLFSWKRGTVQSVEGTKVVLREDSGEETEILVAPVGNLATDWIICESMNLLHKQYLDIIGKHQGKIVEIGLFFSLSDDTMGAALWSEGSLLYWYPFGPEPFRNDVVSRVIEGALKIPPSEREAFGRALKGSSAIAGATADATNAVLSFLVSDPTNRLHLARDRFRHLGPFAAELRRWGYFSLPGQRVQLPEELRLAGARAFDFPGFTASMAPIEFLYLLPTFDHGRGDSP